MKMFAAAGVFSEESHTGNAIRFRVIDQDMLEYVSLRPYNALLFLQFYIEKTLRDSGLWHPFQMFFDEQSQTSLIEAKAAFELFCYQHTPIGNRAETGRIFSKVLNPLAIKYRKRGILKGRMSTSVMTLNELAYNRPNWRDETAKKDKNVARRAHTAFLGDEHATKEHLVKKQMRFLKQFNAEYRDSKSEVVDMLGLGHPATQAHHIFPKSQFPTIADHLENLIMLTSSQHYEKAHPHGNTQAVDSRYQYVCLQSKVASIRENIENEQGIPVIYDFNRLLKTLDCGFGTDFFTTIDTGDFNAVEQSIAAQYPPAIVHGKGPTALNNV